MTAKTYTVVKTRRGQQTETTGTVAELIQHFGYTLEAGNSWDRKVNRNPKTAKSLVTALNHATSALQPNSYDPNYYELITA